MNFSTHTSSIIYRPIYLTRMMTCHTLKKITTDTMIQDMLRILISECKSYKSSIRVCWKQVNDARNQHATQPPMQASPEEKFLDLCMPLYNAHDIPRCFCLIQHKYELALEFFPTFEKEIGSFKMEAICLLMSISSRFRSEIDDRSNRTFPLNIHSSISPKNIPMLFSRILLSSNLTHVTLHRCLDTCINRSSPSTIRIYTADGLDRRVDFNIACIISSLGQLPCLIYLDLSYNPHSITPRSLHALWRSHVTFEHRTVSIGTKRKYQTQLEVSRVEYLLLFDCFGVSDADIFEQQFFQTLFIQLPRLQKIGVSNRQFNPCRYLNLAKSKLPLYNIRKVSNEFQKEHYEYSDIYHIEVDLDEYTVDFAYSGSFVDLYMNQLTSNIFHDEHHTYNSIDDWSPLSDLYLLSKLPECRKTPSMISSLSTTIGRKKPKLQHN